MRLSHRRCVTNIVFTEAGNALSCLVAGVFYDATTDIGVSGFGVFLGVWTKNVSMFAPRIIIGLLFLHSNTSTVAEDVFFRVCVFCVCPGLAAQCTSAILFYLEKLV